MNIINQTFELFFPPAKSEIEVSFDSALKDLMTQRIARVAKAIFFTISSVALTVSLILTDAGVITWPLAIPAILTTLAAGLIFYRLNSLDNRYIERLTDTVRETCVKKELERIFLSQEPLTQEEVKRSLNGANRLLNFEFFDQERIDNILSIQNNSESKSIAEMANEKNKSIAIDLGSKWVEQGRFDLPSYTLNVGVQWTGVANDPIIVRYQSKEYVEGQALEEVQS